MFCVVCYVCLCDVVILDRAVALDLDIFDERWRGDGRHAMELVLRVLVPDGFEGGFGGADLDVGGVQGVQTLGKIGECKAR